MMTSLTVTVERDQVVDFSEPYFKVHVLVAFSQPSEQLGIIFKPLTRPVWALIGGATLLLGLMLRVTSLTAPSSRPQDYNLSAALLDGLSPFLGKGKLLFKGYSCMSFKLSIFCILAFVVYHARRGGGGGGGGKWTIHITSFK